MIRILYLPAPARSRQGSKVEGIIIHLGQLPCPPVYPRLSPLVAPMVLLSGGKPLPWFCNRGPNPPRFRQVSTMLLPDIGEEAEFYILCVFGVSGQLLL
jgi:hypothetical protein